MRTKLAFLALAAGCGPAVGDGGTDDDSGMATSAATSSSGASDGSASSGSSSTGGEVEGISSTGEADGSGTAVAPNGWCIETFDLPHPQFAIPVALDNDLDGELEVWSAYFFDGDNAQLWVDRMNPDRTWTELHAVAISHEFYHLADVNGDGRMDALGRDEGIDYLLSLANDEGLPVTAPVVTDFIFQLSDITGDGRADHIWYDAVYDGDVQTSLEVQVRPGNGDGTFAEAPALVLDPGGWGMVVPGALPTSLLVVDAIEDCNFCEIEVLLSEYAAGGNGQLTLVRSLPEPRSLRVAANADRNGDGTLDVLVESNDNPMQWLDGDGAGYVEGPSSDLAAGDRGYVYDVDLDGHLDILSGPPDPVGERHIEFVQWGTPGGFEPPMPIEGPEIRDVDDRGFTADLDGDGLLDFTNYSNDADGMIGWTVVPCEG